MAGLECGPARRGVAAALAMGLAAGFGARPALGYDVRLAWSAVGGASGYRVYARHDTQTYGAGSDVGAKAPDPDGRVRVVLTGFPFNSTNYFRVTSYTSLAESAFSNELSIRLDATATATLPPTSTPSLTPTKKPTATGTFTASRTPTRTRTATPTRTSSLTATSTGTPTPVAVSTGTATASASQTPTLTPASAPTATPVQPVAYSVSGYVRYYSNALPVGGVAVRLAGAAPAVAQSDAAGQFVLAGIEQGNWQISPQKWADGEGAISALDANYVLQSVVGSRALSTEQRLACDVTGDGTVSALDAALILQLEVGLISSFPVVQACGSDWVFMPTPAGASNQRVIQPQPMADSCQAAAIVYEPLVSPADHQDFSAVLFGDCTGNWQPGGLGP